MILRYSVLLIGLLAATGCGLLFTDWYEPPTESKEYSIVLGSYEDKARVRIVGVDRKDVSYSGGLSDDIVPALKALSYGYWELSGAVQLSTGTHRIEIEACETAFTYWSALTYGLAGEKCGHAVIRIDAQDQEIYQVKSKVSKRHDYADIWLDSITRKQTIIGPIRVAGLKTY